MKINFGLIGFSDISERFVIDEIISNPKCSIKKIASKTKTVSKQILKKTNAIECKDYLDVINDKNIDAIYISIPTGIRFRWTKLSLKAKKHVLIEKPATMNLFESRKITKLAMKNKLVLKENFMFLHHKQHKFVKKIIDNHDIGKIKVINCIFTYPHFKKNNYRNSKSLGGGALYDVGCYSLKLANFFLGEKLKINNSTLIKKKGIDIFGNISLSNSKHQILNSVFGYNAPYKNNYEIICQDGYIKVFRAFSIPPNNETRIDIFKNNKLKTYFKPDNHFKNILNNFLIDIRKRNYLKNSKDIMLQSSMISKVFKYNDFS
jgi:NDP-hexose-3-ketoreductase